MARGYPPEAQRHVVSASRQRGSGAPGIAGVEGILAAKVGLGLLPQELSGVAFGRRAEGHFKN